MGYYSVTKDMWQDFLKIVDEDIPERLIIEGHIHWPRLIEQRGLALQAVREGWMPNLVLGEHGGRLVGYGVCFGGPIASQFAHIYCKMGTEKIIQIGICGALRTDIELGDIIVSEGVLSLDGSARQYGLSDDGVEFDPALRDRAVEMLEGSGRVVHVGRTVSYYDILLERMEDLEDLSERGYIGVEMEAAAVGAVANHFGTPALSVQTVSDNSLSGKDLFYDQTDEEKEGIRSGMDEVFRIALEL